MVYLGKMICLTAVRWREMMLHTNNDYLVSRGGVWTCQNIKIFASQSAPWGKSWSQDQGSMLTPRYDLLTVLCTLPDRWWFASLPLLWPVQPYGIIRPLFGSKTFLSLINGPYLHCACNAACRWRTLLQPHIWLSWFHYSHNLMGESSHKCLKSNCSNIWSIKRLNYR